MAETAQRNDIGQQIDDLKALSESLFAQHVQMDDRFEELREALDDVTNRLLDAILQQQPAAEKAEDGDGDKVSEPEVVEAA